MSRGSHRRMLGDARREAAEAAHIARAKRRRTQSIANAEDDEDAPGPVTFADDDGPMFADGEYGRDDDEADAIYAAIDSRMSSRRKRQREMQLQKDLREYRKANPTVRQQFANLKQGLGSVSMDEWASIPDIGDHSVQHTKWEKYTPAPDSLLESARRENAVVAQTAGESVATDLASIGVGRTSVLGQRLDTVDESTEKAKLNVERYLNEMNGNDGMSLPDIGDLKKARLLMKSLTSSNPSHAPGWIAAARVEENARDIYAARQIILKGCHACPKREDVWIEAARLHTPAMGKRILAQAVKQVPRSAKIWIQAATLENDVKAKRKVLRKALEILPTAEDVWKAAVELENPKGAEILLGRAVECAPQSANLWMALARLQSYEKAKITLERASRVIPSDPVLVITAAHLEEAQDSKNSTRIKRIVQKGVDELSKRTELLGREDWLRLAGESDSAGYNRTVNAIIDYALSLKVGDSERESTWTCDADNMEEKKFYLVARAIYRKLTSTFPGRRDLWEAFARFEKRIGSIEEYDRVLEDGIVECSNDEVLWLMLAKEKWKRDGTEGARQVLRRGFEANPESESIWLAAAKVETECGEFEKARKILRRVGLKTARVYMKCALLERQVGNEEAEIELLRQGVEKHPEAEKLWLMLAQMYERNCKGRAMNLKYANEVYMKGVKHCKKSVALWIGYGRNEEETHSRAKGRAIFEKGRMYCKGMQNVDLLWRECVYLEVRDNNIIQANSVLRRALLECKNSGKLWALSIGLAGRSEQKAKSVDAIKHCPHEAEVLLEVAKYIWRSGKIEKARSWMNRSTEMNNELGDTWATWLVFERENGDKSDIERIEDQVNMIEPKYGDVWIKVAKKVGNERLGAREILYECAGRITKDCNINGVI